MADNPLLQALLGVNVTPQETLFGQGAQTMGTLMPNVYSPYVSPGRNLASIAGAGLLAGLMGYAAKREAEAENRALAPQLSSILSAQTPEELSTLASAEGFSKRLLPVAQQMMLQRLTQQQTAAEKAAEREAALQEAAIKGLSDIGSKYGIPGVAEELAKKAGITLPTIAAGDVTEPLLTPEEKQRRKEKEADIKRQQFGDIQTQKQQLRQDPSTQKYSELLTIKKQLESIIGINNKAAADVAKKLFTKALDPASTITLPEFQLNNQMQSAIEQWSSYFNAKLKGESDLTEETKREMLDVVNRIMQVSGERYNETVNTAIRGVKEFGYDWKPSQIRPYPKFVTQTELAKVQRIGEKVRAARQSGKVTPEEIAALEAQYRQAANAVLGDD